MSDNKSDTTEVNPRLDHFQQNETEVLDLKDDQSAANQPGPSRSNQISLPSVSQPEKFKIRSKRRRKQRRISESQEVDDILEHMEDDIDNVLEQTVQKTKLTAVNVKNILRHVITNEHVLAMVWNTMNAEGGTEKMPEAFYEPKLTRSKVKELWKNSSEVESSRPGKRLLEEDFPENESSDEEYKPTCEPEEDSEDEDPNASFVTSYFGSPDRNPSSDRSPSPYRSPSLDRNPSLNQNPLPERIPSSDRIPSPDPIPSLSIVDTTELNVEMPHSEDDSKLILAEDYTNVEDLDNTVMSSPGAHQISESDRIALRTRSRLPLDDTPLESIEAAFIAPDITVDMYESTCDDEDWRNFLNGFFKPLEQTSEVVDDEINDPEYNFLEDDCEKMDQWDLRNDKAVKVSKKELNDLVAALMEATDQEFGGDEDGDDSDARNNTTPQYIYSSVNEQSDYCVAASLRAVLDEQMRQHVQLLAQMWMLCVSNPNLINYASEYKTFILELSQLAQSSNIQNSAFSACNLEGAVLLLESQSSFQNQPLNLVNTRLIPPVVRGYIQNNPVFLYPHLLPENNIRRNLMFRTPFLLAEDTLVAYGLEQFSSMDSEPHRIDNVVSLIHSHMVPVRTAKQIKIRIKNVKQTENREHNPIGYYFTYGRAPRPPLVVPEFHTGLIVPPNAQPMSKLPKWMSKYTKTCSSVSSLRNLAPMRIEPLTVKNKSTPLTIKNKLSPLKGNLSKKSSSLILPKPVVRSPIKVASPMKHASLILKKYGLGRGATTSNRVSKIRPLLPKVETPQTEVLCKPVVKMRPLSSPTDNVSSNTIKLGEFVNTNSVEIQAQSGPNITDVQDLSGANNMDAQDCSSPPAIFANQNSPIDGDPANDCGSQSEIDTCEEDEENLDNEGDLAALMVASSTICKSVPMIRKKKKQQREVELILPLLEPDILESDPLRSDRETAYIHNYMRSVRDTLMADPATYEEYLATLCAFGTNQKTEVELFEDVCRILKNYPKLVYDFVPFLSAEEALACGCLEEHTVFRKMQTFLRKVEIGFSQHPHHLQRIVKTLIQLQQSSSLTSDSVHSSLDPLFKNQTHLIDELSLLLPDDPPPTTFEEFEEFQLPNSDTEEFDGVEEIIVPETEDLYGTKQCPCKCHSKTADLRMKNRRRHCAQCGIKFIDGRIFLQMGKVPKPTQVICHAEFKLNLEPRLNVEDSNTTKITEKSPCEIRGVELGAGSEQSSGNKVSIVCESESLPLQESCFSTAESGTLIACDPKSVISEPSTLPENPLGLETIDCSAADWNKDEDKLLLETCQKMNATDEAFQNVSSLLPHRKQSDIKNRFWELICLFSANESDEEAGSEGEVV